MKVNDYLPIAHALRETIAALGRDAGAEILLAFFRGPATPRDDGERLRRLREMPAAFPFVTLLPFSASLSGIYRIEGARFDHVLFHAIDPERLVAWNVLTPEPESDRAARPPLALSLGELGTNTPLWSILGAGVARRPGEPDDKGMKKRTLIYMEKGRTVVMTLEDPAPK